MTELMRAHLLAERCYVHYELHDLLRQYALDLAHCDDDVEVAAALRRLAEHFSTIGRQEAHLRATA